MNTFSSYGSASPGFHQQNPDGSWEWSVNDGLNSVRGMVDASLTPLESRQYSPFGEPFGMTGTQQTPFGFTGELTDGNSLVQLRSRYYNPFLGIFPELDIYEGMINDPMSLNHYSYVENNPVNAVDPSGMVMERPEWLSGCFEGLEQQQTIPCDIRDSNGVNVLAFTADSETDGGGPLSQNSQAVAALMLMQINNFRTGKGNAHVNGHTWRAIGPANLANIRANNQRPTINAIAELMVEGYCQYHDPLALFDPFRVGTFRTEVNLYYYPDILEHLWSLQNLAQDNSALFEVSYAADRANQIQTDPHYSNPYVVTAPGATRGIAVGKADITNLSLDYQCPSGGEAVLTNSPDILGTPLSERSKYNCKRCNPTTRFWWYKTPNAGSYVKLSERDFQREFRANGERGSAYVADCSE